MATDGKMAAYAEVGLPELRTTLALRAVRIASSAFDASEVHAGVELATEW